MTRSAFNPDRVRGPVKDDSLFASGGRARRADQPMTVSMVGALVKDVIAQGIAGKIRVIGEVSNFTDRGHWFFSLKDESAILRCVCFSSAARKISIPVTDGIEVIVTGRIDYYEAQGSLQLYVDRVEPVGQGVLEMRLRALCDELRKLGYFDPARKKPVPFMAGHIAVVTSRTGAAWQDVINTASRRWPGCRLYLVDVHVQGATSAPEIAEAIDALSKHGPGLGIEVIILTRGGGSIEDLWAFNERIVADSIYHCQLPIVAAIGHESDTTIAELVADVRCATPTQAAVAVVPERQVLAHQVYQLARRLSQLVSLTYKHRRRHLDTVARHPLLRRPSQILAPPRHRLELVSDRLAAALPRRVQAEHSRIQALRRHPFLRLPQRVLEPAREQIGRIQHALHAATLRRLATETERLAAWARQLEAIAPANVLSRGYSYTLGPDEKVLRSVQHVVPGDRVTTVLADGRFNSRVEGAGAPGQLVRTPRPTKRRKETDQLPLFTAPQ